MKFSSFGLPQHHLKQDEPTYVQDENPCCICYSLSQNKGIVLPAHSAEHNIPHPNQWDHINKIVAVHNPAEEITLSILMKVASGSLAILCIRASR